MAARKNAKAKSAEVQVDVESKVAEVQESEIEVVEESTIEESTNEPDEVVENTSDYAKKLADAESKVKENSQILKDLVTLFNASDGKSQAALKEKLSEVAGILRSAENDKMLYTVMTAYSTPEDRMRAIARHPDFTYDRAAIHTATDGTRSAEIVTKESRIMLSGISSDEIGADCRWRAAIDKVNVLLAIRMAPDLGIKAEELLGKYAGFRIASCAKEFSLPISKDDGSNPWNVSNNKLTAALNQCIEYMIGDGFKCISCDTHFILKAFTRYAGTCKIKTAKQEEFYNIVLDVAHKLITDGNYELLVGIGKEKR